MRGLSSFETVLTIVRMHLILVEAYAKFVFVVLVSDMCTSP